MVSGFMVYNGCPFIIWYGLPFSPSIMYTGSGAAPNYPSGWTANPSTSVTFEVPDNWTAGRIWVTLYRARRNCDFSTNPGPNSCLDGGCNGGLVCTQPGIPPATLAEFTLAGDGNTDYYDVSLVDGYNLPTSISNTVGCGTADCTVDLGPNCLCIISYPTGFPVGCKSACEADLDGNPSNSSNCCTGQYSTPQTCPSSVEPALWACPSSHYATYTVTFCP
ncbi:thaumatin-like protein [Amanita rubescens]|nr:thaumatin-like protein [Amanita rubescens]